MKTLIIFNDIKNPIQFLIVDGDYSRFHGVVVNGANESELEGEFCNWMFDEETGETNNLGQWSEDKALLENKEWDKVAICTFLP